MRTCEQTSMPGNLIILDNKNAQTEMQQQNYKIMTQQNIKRRLKPLAALRTSYTSVFAGETTRAEPTPIQPPLPPSPSHLPSLAPPTRPLAPPTHPLATPPLGMRAHHVGGVGVPACCRVAAVLTLNVDPATGSKRDEPVMPLGFFTGVSDAKEF